MRNIINIAPRRIFLLDAVGAFVSTLLLLAVAHFESVFGMPGHILLKLAPVTATFALYSFIIYFHNPAKYQYFLVVIAGANLVYCSVTAGLIGRFFTLLTPLGVVYFVGEILIIVLLAVFELKSSLAR